MRLLKPSWVAHEGNSFRPLRFATIVVWMK